MQSDVLDIVASYPKLAARLKERPQERARMEKLVAEINGDYSPAMVKTLATMIDPIAKRRACRLFTWPPRR